MLRAHIRERDLVQSIFDMMLVNISYYFFFCVAKGCCYFFFMDFEAQELMKTKSGYLTEQTLLDTINSKNVIKKFQEEKK
jgi:hypothetical protein